MCNAPASRAAWEAQKRLKKRADTVSSFTEKREELEIALKTAEKAKAQLSRCQQEEH